MAGLYLPRESVQAPRIYGDASNVEQSQLREAAFSRQANNYSLPAVVGGVALGAIPDTIDTVASSVGLIERGELMRKTLNAIGTPGLMDFYSENKGAIEVGSGIASVVAADYAAGRFLRPAGTAMKFLQGTRFGNRIATLDAKYERAMRAAQLTAQVGAKQGRIGVEQLAGDVVLPSLARSQTVKAEGVNRALRWAKIERGAARNATTEALLAGFANENGFLFSEDMGENLAWMGLGLAGGAAIDRMTAVYSMRKYVNRDVVGRKFAKAYDPTGLEADRLRATLTNGADAVPEDQLSHLGYLSGHYFDRATSYMTSARSLMNRGLTRVKELAGRRERFGGQQITLARDEAQKGFSRGIKGVPDTAAALSTPGVGNHVDMRLNNDPTFLYGVEQTAVAPSLTLVHGRRQANLDRRQAFVAKALADGGLWRNRQVIETHKTKTGKTIRLKIMKKVLIPLKPETLDAYRTEYRQMVFQQSLTPVVSLGDEWAPLSTGKLLDNFEEPRLRLEESDERKIWSLDEPDAGPGMRMGVANDGEVFLPKGKRLEDLDFFDSLRLYRLGQSAVDDMAAKKTKLDLTLKSDPTWFDLDMAEALVAKTKDESLVQWPAGMTRQTAQVESLKQKVAALRKHAPLTSVPPLKIRRDNPGGEWLERKKAAAEAAYNPSKPGLAAKGLSGSTTAAIQNPVPIRVAELRNLKGVNNEVAGPGNPKYDAVEPEIRNKGYDESKPIMIMVNHKGEAYIAEGNNRVAAAIANGIEAIPAEIHYRNGGEYTTGKWAFHNLKKMIGERIQKTASIWDDPDQVQRARMKFNLPALSAYESGLLGTSEHPLDVILRGLDETTAAKMTHQEILKGIQDVQRINGIGAEAKSNLDSLAGKMFNFLRDDAGNPIKPILAYKRPFAPHEWVKDELAERLAMRKLWERTKLLSGTGEMTRSVPAALWADPDFQAATMMQGLSDSQVQSFLPGFTQAAPQTTRGGFLSSVVTREWFGRDNPVLLAAGRVRDKAERLVRDMMKNRVESALGDVVSRVNGPRNQQTRLLLNQFATFRSGWDIPKPKRDNPVVVERVLPNGRKVYAFKLDPKSAHNATRWQKVFNEAIPEDATLHNPQGKEVVVDELGLEFLNRYRQLTDDIVNEKNSLLAAQGLGKINSQFYYTPPPGTAGKYIGFTLDMNRKPVPNGTIVASTPEEFDAMLNRLRDDKDSVLNRDGNIFYTQDELSDFADVWDRAQMNWMDPGTTAAQPGKRGTGTLVGSEINPNAFDDMLTWVRDSYLQHGDNILRMLFKDQINSAKTRAKIAQVQRKNTKGDTSTGRTIYDHYVETLSGRLGITSPGSAVGRLYRGVEDWADRILAEATPHVSKTWRNFHDAIRAGIPSWHGKDMKAAYDKLAEDLGPYMPFKSAAEMAEKQLGATRPVELSQITGNMSKFEALMRLRLFEVIHPVMNLSGILAASPSVIRHLQKLPGETAEDYTQRIGHSAQIFDLPNSGKQIGVLDMAKIMHRAMKRAWSRESDAEYKFMMGRGYITQEVAEFQRQFGAINSKSKWRAFFLSGDVNRAHDLANKTDATLKDQIQGKVFEKGLAGWLSVLSDKSEDFSRSWGHMVGLEVADMLGIVKQEARHSFAHDVANKMIANYDPKNRPEVFQGALGAPIGLFQSFIWNYYQRLFRYIETGDKRSLATQLAVQGSLFGATSVPGWSAINKLFFDHSDGNNSPYDAIYERFGQETGDVLMAGVLSNLPKMFNMLPGEQGVEGVDLYSRGDTNIRGVPVLNVSPPFVDSVRRIWNGFGQGMDALFGDHPNLTTNQLAEIASNALTNRPLAGFIEQTLAEGYDTDIRGQVAADSKGMLESTYRILGGRSMRQAKELEAFYSNKNAVELQNAKMEELRLSIRSAMRAGDVDSIPEYFTQYVLNGGDPKRFKQFVKSNAEAALETRSERMLNDLIKNPRKMDLVQRLLDAEVGIDESEDGADAFPIGEIEDPSLNPDLPAELTDPANAIENTQMMDDPSFYRAQ